VTEEEGEPARYGCGHVNVGSHRDDAAKRSFGDGKWRSMPAPSAVMMFDFFVGEHLTSPTVQR